MYSSILSNYYDVLMGDYSSIVQTTKKLMAAHASSRMSVLEIGCGTGNILDALPKSYRLHGLDNSENMLAVARKKVPHAYFFHGDMCRFSLNQKFDTVLCIFDSINHLTSFTQWKQCFSQVSKHLSKGGVFIFDMNTARRLETLATLPVLVKKLDRSSLASIKINKQKKALYSVSFQIFEQIHTKHPRYSEEVVLEAVVATQTVHSSLEKYFVVEKMVDPIRKRITKNTGRIFFVCRKK